MKASHLATERAKYERVEVRKFKSYPEDYQGEFINLDCKVFRVVSRREFQCFMGDGFDALYVISRKEYNDIYEDDALTVYGQGNGTYCGTNAFGAEVCHPLITMDFYEKY